MAAIVGDRTQNRTGRGGLAIISAIGNLIIAVVSGRGLADQLSVSITFAALGALAVILSLVLRRRASRGQSET